MSQLSPLFARQPIFDRELEVFAYELLFRPNDTSAPASIDGDCATSHVLQQAFRKHEVTQIAGSHKVFVNFTRKLLLEPPPLPSDQLVIEVLEDITPDDSLVTGLRELKAAGYAIALDDFVLSSESRVLLEYADIVKIDVLALQDEALVEHLDILQRYPAKLLAEKVETDEVLELCKTQGFDYFQGYLLSRPQIIKDSTMTDSKSKVVQRLGRLVSPMTSFDDLVETIATDPELTREILRLVNSASVGLRRPIATLPDAIAMQGLAQIRNWAVFLLLKCDTQKPAELSILSLTRARFTELLATRIYGRATGETAFAVGLLSNLDAFLDTPMDQLAGKLHFAEQVESALVRHAGKTGELLQVVLQHETGNWKKMDWQLLQRHKLGEAELGDIYTDALAWAKQMLATLG